MKTRIQFLGVAAGLALATSAQAASVLVNNSSFEADVLGDGSLNVAAPTGWTWDTAGDGGYVGPFNPSSAHFTVGVPDGDNSLFQNGPESVSQTLPTVLVADTLYTLTVAVGDRLDTTFSGYAIELFAGATLLAGIDSTTGPVPGNDSWTDVTLTYTSGSSVTADPLQIRLRSLSDGTQTNFDNVRLDGTLVPEPSTALLGGLGVLALLRRRRR